MALVLIGASGIEVILHLRGVLWSTATICLILLFFALTVTKVLYDPLTGTYSRLAYQKRLECIRWKSQITLAYGVRQGRGAEVEKLLGEVDSQMYVNKAQNLADDVSHPEPSGGYFGGGQA